MTQQTNAAAGSTNSDQPWLVAAPNPSNLSQDNVYVAYDDFTVSPVGMRVAASSNAKPPNFATNVNTGSGGGINPGHRLAADKKTGVVYDLFQRSTSGGDDSSKNINYMLNRSTDGGNTWTLNGSSSGWQVANADSDQPTAKFGSTNALLGGVDAVTVDSNTGEVYVAYGNRDPGTNNNRISVARLQDDGSGNMVVANTSFLTGQVQAALPSLAVGAVCSVDGTINVGAGGNRKATETFTLGPAEFKQIVLTIDTVPPTIFGPANIVTFSTKATKRVSFRLKAVDDEDGRVPVSCHPRSGSVFHVGRTRVTCSAHDFAGNVAKYHFRVVVKRKHT